jgi:hypothetical protein
MKTIVILNQLPYPYGKKQVYLGSTLPIVASQIERTSFYNTETYIKDLNFIFDRDLPDFTQQSEESAIDVIKNNGIVGTTVIGPSYIPIAIKYAEKISSLGILIMIGGQPIAKMSQELFRKLFKNPLIQQIRNNSELSNAIGTENTITDACETSLSSVYGKMENMEEYLKKESALYISQGCLYNCKFCGAEKNQQEKFKNLDLFKEDLTTLTKIAKGFGYKKLEFYASNLDFFQNPFVIVNYLQAIIDVKKEVGIDIRVRCLACMLSFIRACELMPNLKDLLKEAGLWCIGFGVDGSDKTVWKAQNKNQNKEIDVIKCLDLCKDYGIRFEMLMIMGFTQDTKKTLWKNFVNAYKYVTKYDNVMLRPYLAKEIIPGNEEWNNNVVFQEKFVRNPELFYNLDFCMIGSKLTHPKFWHRFWSNLTFLAICGIFTPLGKCCTSPLMPYGGSKIWNMFAKLWNKIVPFDR